MPQQAQNPVASHGAEQHALAGSRAAHDHGRRILAMALVQPCKGLAQRGRLANLASVENDRRQQRDQPGDRGDPQRRARPVCAGEHVVVEAVLLVPQPAALKRLRDRGEMFEEFEHEILIG